MAPKLVQLQEPVTVQEPEVVQPQGGVLLVQGPGQVALQLVAKRQRRAGLSVWLLRRVPRQSRQGQTRPKASQNQQRVKARQGAKDNHHESANNV